jgi:pyruvate/2-oxoglutarate dehydrogenase complex dihydrolipoamide acyltransferase (E2) component
MTSKMRIALSSVSLAAVLATGIAAGWFQPDREPTEPPRPPAPATRSASVASAPPSLPAAEEPAVSADERELAEPERLEAEAYPWQEFEAILGRTLDAKEKDRLRDLRKEHGLRLADEHGKMERGEITRAAFDTWRTSQSEAFRVSIEEELDCSPDELAQLLAVELRAPGG